MSKTLASGQNRCCRGVRETNPTGSQVGCVYLCVLGHRVHSLEWALVGAFTPWGLPEAASQAFCLPESQLLNFARCGDTAWNPSTHETEAG